MKQRKTNKKYYHRQELLNLRGLSHQLGIVPESAFFATNQKDSRRDWGCQCSAYCHLNMWLAGFPEANPSTQLSAHSSAQVTHPSVQEVHSGLFWWGPCTINSARYPTVTSHLVSSSQGMFRLVYVHRNLFMLTVCKFNVFKNTTIQSTSTAAQPKEEWTMRPWQATAQRCKREGRGPEISRPLPLKMKSHSVQTGSTRTWIQPVEHC